MNGINDFKSVANEINCELKNIEKFWDGKSAIMEMKDNGYNQWKQMEWIGFYFQYLCEKNLNNIMKIPGNKYCNVEFDAFKNNEWDFKCHIQKTVKGKNNSAMIINDVKAINDAINRYGSVGLIVGLGTAKFNDEDRTFQNWVENLKGGKSNYEEKRIERGASSRLRKVAFNLECVMYIKIDQGNLKNLGKYNQGKNSNGTKREPKYMFDLNNLDLFEHYSSSQLC